MPKNYSGTYIYGKYPDYDKMLFEFIMKADELDKKAPGFDDIIFEVKRRQISPALVKVLQSDGVILLSGPRGLPRQFKAFCAKDIKRGNKKDLKVYIDITDVIVKNEKSGEYKIKDVDRFISYLVSAMTNYIYYKDEKRFISNHSVTAEGAKAFSDLLTNVVSNAAKLSSTSKNISYVRYLSALYYLSNILGRDYTAAGDLNIARKIAGLSDREADIVDMQLTANSFDDIKFFVKSMAEIIRVDKLTTEVVVERWTFLYGPATVFGLELFPAFATMITDCYVGAYLNNQKTIEKITGTSMVQFAKAILDIGAGAV